MRLRVGEPDLSAMTQAAFTRGRRPATELFDRYPKMCASEQSEGGNLLPSQASPSIITVAESPFNLDVGVQLCHGSGGHETTVAVFLLSCIHCYWSLVD